MMSIQSSITFLLQPYEPFDVINSLINSGWTLNDYGHITYSLISDDFTPTQIAWNNDTEDIEIIKKTAQKSPLKTICMTWKDTKIGGIVLFETQNKISFILSINRKEIPLSGIRITDYNWYIERLLATFNNNEIEQISWEQYGGFPTASIFSTMVHC